jgi:hypothetical protein
MGFFHKSLSKPPLPVPSTAKAARGEHLCPGELVEADPVVVKIFAELQTAWRHQRGNHLLAPQRRMQRHKDSERRAWARLANYLSRTN